MCLPISELQLDEFDISLIQFVSSWRSLSVISKRRRFCLQWCYMWYKLPCLAWNSLYVVICSRRAYPAEKAACNWTLLLQAMVACDKEVECCCKLWLRAARKWSVVASYGCLWQAIGVLFYGHQLFVICFPCEWESCLFCSVFGCIYCGDETENEGEEEFDTILYEW